MKNYDAIVAYLPKEGLITKYMQLTSGTEVCPRFRFFTCIGILGAVVNRKVFLQRGSKETFPTLYPNPWIFLIAPQGKGKKSSAVRVARQIFNALPPNKKPTILSSKLTPEVMVKGLSSSAAAEMKVPANMLHIVRKKAIGVILSSELGTLLGREKYLTGMAMLLTDLYDCHDEWDSSTIMRGDDRLYEICLSIIAASTPDWMQSLMPKDAFEIGFMSRMVLVPMPFGWRPRVIPEPSSTNLFNEVVDCFAEISDITGEMILSDEAWVEYKKWYLNLPELPPGPQAEYLERKQDHALRIAILLQLAETKELVLEGKYFTQALSILTSIEPEVNDLISYISMEPRMRIVKKILTKVEFEGKVRESDLLEDVWFLLSRPGEFNEVMELLVRTKKVIWETSSKGNIYRIRKENE